MMDMDAEPLEIVATTAFVADWIRNVAGDRAEVTSLVPRNADPHSFQPGARDIVRVAEADAIFGIGLGLEDTWLVDLIENAAPDDDAFVSLGDGDEIDPIEFGEDMHDDHMDEDEHDHEDGDDHMDEDEHDHDEDEHDHEDGDEHDEDEHDHDEDADHDEDEDEHDHEDGDEHDEDEHDHEEDADHDEDEDEHDHDHEEEGDHDEDEHEEEGAHAGHDHHGHDHGDLDPHFWFDPIRVAQAVNNIAERLSEIDPDNADLYAANAIAYASELAALDAWVFEQVALVPADDRKLATSHDAFRYFALRYGFEIIGTVIPGGGTEIEPSAQEIAALVDSIRDEGVKAVFTETTVSDTLTRRVAEEAGARIVSDLYTGSLSAEGGEAETYLKFMRYNTSTIVNALK